MAKLSNKALGIYFIVFAVLYFGYTVFVAGHGVHWMNAVVTIAVLASGIYFALKGHKSNK